MRISQEEFSRIIASITSGEITEVNFEGNRIGDEGAVALARALSTNTSLTSINLRHNNIGAEGAATLAGALSTNTSLTSIDLRGNNIGAAAEEALAEALQHNTSLTNLAIDNLVTADDLPRTAVRQRITTSLEHNEGQKSFGIGLK